MNTKDREDITQNEVNEDPVLESGTPEFAMGALIPPDSSWMEGRTAGEISLIRYVQCTRDYLNKPTDRKKNYLLMEATSLLRWIGVEK